MAENYMQDTNIFRKARLDAPTKLSQEDAAAWLHISESTLSRIETGKATPDEDLLQDMIALYDAPGLAVALVLDALKLPLKSELELNADMWHYGNPDRLLQAMHTLNAAIQNDGKFTSDERPAVYPALETLRPLADTVYGMLAHMPAPEQRKTPPTAATVCEGVS